MEIDELKAMWLQYDNKLDNLEKLNKRLIFETLSKKPQQKINWRKYQSLYGLIAVPVILIVALHPNFTLANLDWKFILGCILTLSVIVYVSVINFKSYMILKGIRVNSDSLVESIKKVVEFKQLFNRRWRDAIFFYPIIYIGCLLIGWNSFRFDTKTILSLVFLFIVTYLININVPKAYRSRVERLEKELQELKDYTNGF